MPVIAWERLEDTPESVPVTGAAALEVDRRVWIFGGWGNHARPADLRHEIYDTEEKRWLPAAEMDVGGAVPMPRVGHSVTRMSGSVFLFGGQKLYPSSGGYDGILDDLYMGAIPQPGVINWHCLKQPSDPPV